MNTLKRINGLFTKFWRWIKETAWVQPLLIVGGIFAIIFSISKFNKWFSTMAVGTSSGYFTSYRMSLENEGRKDYDTPADKITSSINKFSFDEFQTYEEAKAALEKDGVIKEYGIKYYFMIVEQDCTGCTNAEQAFQTLQSNWNTQSFKIDDGGTFALHAIFADDISTNDNDFELDEDKKAFYRYVKKFSDVEDFWTLAAGKLYDAPYKQNAGVADSKYETLENAEAENMETPTIFLVDWTEEAFDAGRFGISEVVFGFTTGTSTYDRATLLQNMWNHIPSDDSEAAKDIKNPFRVEYQK